MMDTQITIIGAGVVGLAIAERVTKDFKDVFQQEQ
jgi:L-2-hydroxyglutarate oxidase LhgO